MWFAVDSSILSGFKPRQGVLAKNHVKGIIIVGVTQPEKKILGSSRVPRRGQARRRDLLGVHEKKSTLLAQMVLLSKFPLKTGSVQVPAAVFFSVCAGAKRRHEGRGAADF